MITLTPNFKEPIKGACLNTQSSISLVIKKRGMTVMWERIFQIIFTFIFLGIGFKINAQTAPNLGEAKTFALLSGDTISSTDTVNVLGNTGAFHYINNKIQSTSIHTGDSIVTVALNDLESAIGFCNTQSGISISGVLNEQMLTAGVYYINGNAFLSDTLTLSGDTSAVFIFNVSGDLNIDTGIVLMNGVSTNKIFWNVGGNVMINKSYSFNGTIMSNGNIDIVAIDQMNYEYSLFSRHKINMQKSFTISSSALGSYSLFLCTSGIVYRCGYSGGGYFPSIVPGAANNNIVEVSVGDGSHGLALKNDGTVWAWGSNTYGQLGTGTTSSSSSIVQVSGLTDIIAVSAGTDHSMALRNDGTVWIWGRNYYGALGNGGTDNLPHPIPTQMPGLQNVSAISAGTSYSLVITNGQVWGWGFNDRGQLGNNSTVSQYTPVQESNGFTDVIAISAAIWHSLILRGNGNVFASGDNYNTVLGNGTNIDSHTFIASSNMPNNITAISAGGKLSLALRNDGTVWACGNNFYGSLGNGTNISNGIVAQVLGLTCIKSIKAGVGTGHATDNNGVVFGWGSNWAGAIGVGTNIHHNIPVIVILNCPAMIPEFIITGTNDICLGLSTNLTVSNGIPPFVWSGAGLSSTTGNTVTATPTNTTTYSVTDACGETATFTVNIIQPLYNPTLSVSQPSPMCLGTQCTISVNNYPVGTTFNWSNGVTNSNQIIVSPNLTTTYSVTVSFLNGCPITFSTTVEIKPACTSSNLVIPCGVNNISSFLGSFYTTSYSNNSYGGINDIAINGDLIIDADVAFYDIPNIYIASGVKITVTPGHKIYFYSCNLYTCNNQMWRGIEVEPGGILIFDISHANPPAINIIEDAITAITSTSNWNATDIKLKHTNFNRNYKCIKIDGGNSYSSASSPVSIQSCVFGCVSSLVPNNSNPPSGVMSKLDGPLYSNGYSDNAIEVFNFPIVPTGTLPPVQIGTVGGVNERNYFHYVKNGVYVFNASFKLYNCEFNGLRKNNCATLYPPPAPNPNNCPNLGWPVYVKYGSATIGGTATQVNTFKNCDHAIWFERAYNLDVIGNAFNNITTNGINGGTKQCLQINNCISATNAGNINITGNSFTTIGGSTISYHDNSSTNLKVNGNKFLYYTNGLMALNNKLGTIEVGNITWNDMYNVSNNASGNPVLNGTAINVSNLSSVYNNSPTSSPMVTITKNQITNSKRGIYTYNLSKPLIANNYIIFNSIPTAINPASAATGIESNKNLYESINNNYISNTASGTLPSTKARAVLGINVVYPAGKASVIGNNLLKLGTGIQFQNVVYNDVIKCNSMNGNFFGLVLDNAYVGNQGNPNSASDNTWSNPNNGGAPGTSRSITGYGANTSSIFYTRTNNWPYKPSPFNSYVNPLSLVNAVACSSPGPYQCISDDYHSYELVKIARNESPYDTLPEPIQYMIDKGFIATVMADSTLMDTTFTEGEDIKNYYDSLMNNTIEGEFAQAAEIAGDGNINDAENVNNNIVTTRCSDEAQQAVNDIYYNTWAKEIFEFSPQDSATLLEIAFQNPFYCGTAAYDARLMLDTIITDASDDSNGRYRQDEINIDSEVQESEPHAIGVIYPNPAKNEAFYEIFLQNNEKGSFILYDVIGQRIVTEKLNNGANKLKIDTSKLPSGIYLYKVRINDNIIDSEKIIIQHH